MKLQSNCAYSSLSNKAHRTTLALQQTGRVISGLAFGFIACLLAPGNAEAAQFSFTKVVDTDTPIPGGTGNFNLFYIPALDNGSVAFRGSGGSFFTATFQDGIYTNLGGSLNVVADRNTPIPGRISNIDSFDSFNSSVSLDNGNVAFIGDFDRIITSSQAGIYTSLDGGSLNVIADRNTPVPGSRGNFAAFGTPTLDNGSIAFTGIGGSTSGIYTNLGGSLNVIANRNTPIPSGTGNFTFFERTSQDNGSVAFVGFAFVPGEPLQQGIYTNLGGSLNVIADRNTPIPSGTGNFTSFAALSQDNGSVAFAGSGFVPGEPFQQGIYTNLGGSLSLIADQNTPIPEGTGNFSFIGVPSLNNGNIAFSGSSASPFGGIYTTLGETLTKVIASGDSLDGKIIFALEFGTEGFNGNQIAFDVTFTDNSAAIYIATLDPTSVPESSTVLGILAIGACGASSMLRRKYKKATHTLEH